MLDKLDVLGGLKSEECFLSKVGDSIARCMFRVSRYGKIAESGRGCWRVHDAVGECTMLLESGDIGFSPEDGIP